MTLDRREFLKATASAGCLTAFSGVSNLAYAAQSSGKPLLVSVFLRGGADGLHLVAPSDDPDYIAARPPELRVLDSGDRAGIRLNRSLDSNADFRIHPDAAPLANLYQAGRLAIVHAVGLTDATRSHFVAQDLMDRGVADTKRIANIDSGWLARSLRGVSGMVTGFSATSSTSFPLRGLSSVLSAPDVSGGLAVPWGAPTAGLLQALGMTGTSSAHRASLAALDVLSAVDGKIVRDGAGKAMPYKPDGQGSYEGSGDLARALSSVARLAKMDIGLAAACVDAGGWDTHEWQGGSFGNKVKQLSLGLAAFHDDMAAAGRPVVIVVMTEFGRRLRANKSGGTDHGHAGCWFVLGDKVQGGRMAGKWPGLSTPKLDQGVDLTVTTDYRAVLSEVLMTCGLAAQDSLPEWSPGPRLGLFAG